MTQVLFPCSIHKVHGTLASRKRYFFSPCAEVFELSEGVGPRLVCEVVAVDGWLVLVSLV